jgi:hypothetical protein
MKALRLFLAIGLTLCAAACLPVTTSAPVGSTVGFANDPAIEGTWSGRIDKNSPATTYFHFLANEDNTFTLVGVTTKYGEDKGGWGTYTLNTSNLGGHRYINARETMNDGKFASPEEQKANIPLLYTVSGDTLTLYLLDEDATAAAIASHKIEGKVTKSQYTTDVSITADAAHLDALLKTEDGARLFKVFIVLTRLK